MRAKPTTYAGVRFRSRLEARWASFFDLMGLRWEYEPLDLKGWVPDFLLLEVRGALPVEVKPIAWFGTPHQMRADVLERDDLEKVRAHSTPALVLGAYPFLPFEATDPILGMVFEGGEVSAREAPEAWESAWREAGNVTQWRAA